MREIFQFYYVNRMAEKDALEESMATCRFAQRVAMVSNVVRVNEEVDPQVTSNSLI
jgi:kinesin family member 6/9